MNDSLQPVVLSPLSTERLRSLSIAIVLTLVLGSACIQFSDEASPPLKVDSLWVFRAEDYIRSTPTVQDQLVYVGSDDNHLYAVDAATGEMAWDFQTEGNVSAAPVLDDDRLYVGSWDGHVYALSASSGEEEWRFNTGGWVAGTPVMADGRLYVPSASGVLYALAPDDGRDHWRYQTAGALLAAPAIADGVVVFGSTDNYIYALDATSGDYMWRYRTDGDVSSTPVMSDGIAYVTSTDGSVYALAASGGQLRWRLMRVAPFPEVRHWQPAIYSSGPRGADSMPWTWRMALLFGTSPSTPIYAPRRSCMGKSSMLAPIAAIYMRSTAKPDRLAGGSAL